MSVSDNYLQIKKRVEAACARVHRDPAEVTIIAVSKTKPDEMVEELAGIGVRDFGENKPQELMRKHDGIEGELRWHMIGNIQTNKVKMFVGRAALIHSVSSMHIAEAVSKESVKQGVISDILIEVNIAGEETKHGASLDETLELVRGAAALPNISVRGLMAIVPPTDNPEDSRPYFKQLAKMRDTICAMNIPNAQVTELSMGMTGDFETAVEEGATYVRVGTAIFGERDYSHQT